MRTVLINAYLDFVNNYLTVGKFAEHNHITEEQAIALIDLGEDIFNSIHPEA